jgi:hypothetical protein
MDWLWTRETVTVLAIMGALCSTAASLLQAKGRLQPGRARQLHYSGYGFMALSMLLFIIAGFRS